MRMRDDIEVFDGARKSELLVASESTKNIGLPFSHGLFFIGGQLMPEYF